MDEKEEDEKEKEERIGRKRDAGHGGEDQSERREEGRGRRWVVL